MMSCRIAFLFLLVPTALLEAGAARGADSIPPRGERLEVEVRLLEKAPTPTLEEVHPYTEALGVYRYKVERVRHGTLEADEIAVTHWVLYRRQEQRVARNGPGRKKRLKLVPFETVEDRFQTVYRSDLASSAALPLFHDLGQKVEPPREERARWNYGVDLAEMMPLLFHLKDQVRLVALGDCQAWFANKTPNYWDETVNHRTPVALNLCQQRAGLPFQKLMVEHYLAHLPKLEWVVLTWNPRFVNAAWTEHGIKGEKFQASEGFAYDRAHATEVWAPGHGKPVTVEDLQTSPRFARLWNWRPWGWIYLAPGRHRKNARAEVLANQKKLGRYRFVPERWALFESIVRTLVDHDVRLLVYTTPVHPESARHPVKDKSGVDAQAYRDQVARMKKLEAAHPRHFFFYDLNNMGDNGLEDRDFENIDHVSGTGAEKVSRRVEAFRRQVESRLGR